MMKLSCRRTMAVPGHRVVPLPERIPACAGRASVVWAVPEPAGLQRFVPLPIGRKNQTSRRYREQERPVQ